MADFLVSKEKDPTADLNEARKFLLQASQIDGKKQFDPLLKEARGLVI